MRQLTSEGASATLIGDVTRIELREIAIGKCLRSVEHPAVNYDHNGIAGFR
jgi:hypothetical protein